MRNECFNVFFIYKHYHLDQRCPSGRSRFRSGSQPGEKEIKLQYKIFTNIMTRMLSNVKKKYIGYK